MYNYDPNIKKYTIDMHDIRALEIMAEPATLDFVQELAYEYDLTINVQDIHSATKGHYIRVAREMLKNKKDDELKKSEIDTVTEKYIAYQMHINNYNYALNKYRQLNWFQKLFNSKPYCYMMLFFYDNECKRMEKQYNFNGRVELILE
jgi:hypothetical protein